MAIRRPEEVKPLNERELDQAHALEGVVNGALGFYNGKVAQVTLPCGVSERVLCEIMKRCRLAGWCARFVRVKDQRDSDLLQLTEADTAAATEEA